MPTAPASSTLRARLVSGAALAAWGIAVTVVCGTFLGAHLLTLPVPELGDPRLAHGVASLRTAEDGWTVLHALSSECRCSRAVLEHLLTTPRPGDVEETVLLVGPVGELEARVRAAGFGFVRVTAAELSEQYSIPAVPVMVVADPAGAVRYSGGYTVKKQGPDLRDLDILRGLRGGREVDGLPLFGCAVNTALRASIDPVGLR